MDTDFEKAKGLVEATIAKIGLDPAATRAPCPTDSQAAWAIKRGSASVLVTVTHHEGEGTATIRVVSPVVTLPSGENHTPLLRRLLELNAAGLANAAFGLIGDRVVAVSERPTDGLDGAEVEQIVRHLAAVADTFDDRFQKEFGATKA